MSNALNMTEIKTAIARHRFPFPNREKPAWRTFVNDAADPIVALPTAVGDVYPDILVIDRATTINKYLMAAAVCAGEPSPDEMPHWRAISQVVDFFYVFAPDAQCRRAAELVAAGNIEVAGFRSYALSEGGVTVTDCF